MLDFPVRETILDNGLKVLTVEHRVAPITSVWTWYRVGSRNERPGITGISHWTEHMCFKGGAEFGKGDIFKEVSRVGGMNNGMTGTDYTVYFETLPSDHAELGLRIEADRMASARFEPDEVTSERTVIISEREGAENYPQFLLFEELSLAALRTHPYRWSVVGWKADLQRITHADLWSHYKSFYAPDNAVLLIVGDFETEAMLADVQRLYGGIAGHADVPEVRSVEPPQEGERRFVLRRPGTAAYLGMAFHIPQAGHADEPALRVLTSILSGTGSLSWMAPGGGGWKTSRLYRALVDTELATSAGCRLTPGSIDPGLANFFVTARVGVEPERIEEAVLKVIEEALAAPPTEDEMQKAKTQIRAAVAYTGEGATGIAGLLGQAEMVGSYRDVTTLESKVEAVTAEDVLRVAQTYLTPNTRTTGWFLPTDEKDASNAGGSPARAGEPPALLPALPAMALGGVQAPAVQQFFFYTGLEMFRQARRETLDNGLRVVACQSSLTPSVSLGGVFKGGSVLDTAAQAGRARFAAASFERGTTTKTYRELSEALDGVGATFGVGSTVEGTQFFGNSLSGNLDLLLDTATDMLLNPTFPEEEIGKVRSEILTSLRENEDSTRDVALKAARQLLYPAGHPYHTWERGESEAIAALTREDLLAYHREAVHPDRGIAVLVGDMDPERAVDMVRERLGTWQPAQPPAAFPELAAEPPAEMVTRDVPMASKTQCDIVMATTGVPRPHEDFLPLSFAINILGQLGFMGRFGATVRDELGLAYYCYAAGGELHGPAMWFAQAGVNPKNVQLATDTMLQQTRQMQQELVSQEEYDHLVANLLGSLAMLLEGKSKIMWCLLSIEKWGLGEDYYERYPDLVRGVTREAILEAARKYFRPDAHVRVVAGPEWQG
ncbi:insulinase family protein [bacterium]|nr:insulinase family protein [bacterium]